MLVRSKGTDLRTNTAEAKDFYLIDATYVTEAEEGKSEHTLMARCVQTRIGHPPLGIYGLKLYEFGDVAEYLGALRAFYDDCPHAHADLVIDIAGQELLLRVPLLR